MAILRGLILSARFDIKSKTHAQCVEQFCHAFDIHVLIQRIREVNAIVTCVVITRELTKFKKCMLKEYPNCHIEVVCQQPRPEGRGLVSSKG